MKKFVLRELYELSDDQKRALKILLYWLENRKQNFITLGGFAGSGKTTLISLLRDEISKIEKYKKFKIAFVSFTGKASQVLKKTLEKRDSVREKDFVGTIHSLIYSPIEDKKTEEIVGWEKKTSIEYDLIIIDESSMVNREIWDDITSYQIPIIAVGDHGQLPPISGNFNLMAKPQIRLEKIHRQAEKNPIIKISEMARNFGLVEAKKYGKNILKISTKDENSQELVSELLQNFDENTLVLCGRNTTRIKLNAQIRNNLGFESKNPEVGDRVICLRNNRKKHIFNGMLGKILELEKSSENLFFAKIIFDDGEIFKGDILQEQFGNPNPMNFTKDRKKTLEVDLFDFGYAITVHKAQGSQAKRVILFEERFSQMDDEMWKRWLYTAITRAEEELFIIG